MKKFTLPDSTARVLEEREKNEETIHFIDSYVAPVAALRIGELPANGAMGYSITGGKGIMEIDERGVAVNGYFVRAEEWKATPWTSEESAAYWQHRRVESERVQQDTRDVLNAVRTRQQLRKEFLGR